MEAEKNQVKKHDKSIPKMLELQRSEAGFLWWRLERIMSKSMTNQGPRCWSFSVRKQVTMVEAEQNHVKKHNKSMPKMLELQVLRPAHRPSHDGTTTYTASGLLREHLQMQQAASTCESLGD